MSSWKRLATITLAALALVPAPASAVDPATGFATYSITTPGAVTGDVVRVGDAVFVGQGAFGVGLQTIIRLDGGVSTTIANGFNSLGGFAFDASSGTLYVVDNNGNGMGAVTGDTVFAIPDALTRTTALAALGAEVVPAGSIPAAADVALVGKDLLVTDAVGPGAGRLVRVSKGAVTTVISSGLDYAAGVTVDGTRLLVGNTDDSFVGSVAEYTLAGVLVGPVASGLSGNYAHDVDLDGNILVTGGFADDFSSNVASVAPGGAQSERASGFAFSTGLFHDPARDETLVLDVAVSKIDVICRDADDNGTCFADEPCTDGVGVTNGKLLLKKQNTPAGDDGLKLVGQMTVPVTPALDPVANGARIVVTDDAGTVANVSVPGGAFDDAAGHGWKVNGAGTVWKYLNPAGHAGITKVIVKSVGSTAGLVKFTVIGRNGAFATESGDLPLSATFLLDADGQCGTATFAGCTFNGRGTTVKCQ